MSKYNTFKYGDGTKYGATAATQGGIIQWIVMVDWDGDKVFDGANEGDYLVDLNIKRGREHYLSPDGKGFEWFRPGTATLTFDNKDRRYDPRNAASPLYPNIIPGRQIQVKVKDLSAGLTYTLFTGKIDNIEPINAPGGGQVLFDCTDYLQDLDDQVLTFAATSINTTIEDAFNLLLSNADFPGASSIGTDTQPVIAFAPINESAGTVAGRLAAAGLGNFYIDRNGVAIYRPRDYSHFLWSTHPLDQAQLLNTPVVSQPWNDVYPITNVVANRFIKEQAGVVYFLPSPLYVAATETEILYPQWQASSGVVVSAYGIYSNQDGTGTDRSGEFTIAETLGAAGGEISFTAGANAAYVTQVEIRGRKWRSVQEEFKTEDATAKGIYGARRFYLDSEYLQDPNYASSYSGTLNTFLKADRESIILEIQGREDVQFFYDLTYKVPVTFAALDISDNYYVLGIEHSWIRSMPQSVLTKLWMAKIFTDSTSITAAPLQEEQMQAPLGYDNPAGDPPTLDAYEGVSAGGIDHIAVFSNATIDDEDADRDADNALIFTAVAKTSSDITAGMVWSSGSPSEIHLSKPGVYRLSGLVRLVPLSGYSADARASISMSVWGYEADDSAIGISGNSTYSVSMFTKYLEDFNLFFDQVFSTSWDGVTASYVKIVTSAINPSPLSASSKLNIVFHDVRLERIRTTEEIW